MKTSVTVAVIVPKVPEAVTAIGRRAWFVLTALTALTVFMPTSAHAGQPGTDLQSAAAFPATSPAADKVYPPLPSLAMLPPPGASDDDAPAPRPTSHRKKARAPAPGAERRMPIAPVAKLVVSDASHAYLDSVQKQIDLAMSK